MTIYSAYDGRLAIVVVRDVTYFTVVDIRWCAAFPLDEACVPVHREGVTGDGDALADILPTNRTVHSSR